MDATERPALTPQGPSPVARPTARVIARLAAWGGLALALCLAAVPQAAQAQTYTSASTTFNWVDSSTHTKIGYRTTPYKFNAASGCGTTPPTLDDTLSDSIPIGFTFRYGTTDYTTVYVMTNGRLQFGNTTCGYGTASIGPPQTYPNAYPTSTMNATMKAFGVDLDPTNLVDVPNYPSAANRTPCASIATCYVSVATVGTAPSRQFVVTWKNVPEWVTSSNTSGSFDLQVILNEDGSFVYQYGVISHGGTGTAQIGWQLSTTDYQVLSFGASLEPPANTAIVFYIPSPVAAYRFDEGAWAQGLAGQVVDSSGNARHGSTLGNAQVTASGKLCRGADVPADATTAVHAVKLGVNIANASLNLLGSGTIAFWYRANTAWNSGTAAQLVDATTASGEWFYLTRSATGTLYFAVKDSTGTLRSVESPAQSVAAGTWVHVAVAWSFNGLAGSNQDNLRLYVNGTQVAISSFTSSGTVTTSAGAIHLGDNPIGVADTRGTVNSADGRFDEAQVYNYVLSTSQLGVLIAATRSCAALTLHHLELQHPTGTSVTCSPTTVTVRACADSACTALFTGGVAGAFTATGTSTVGYDGATGYGSGSAFVVPYGASSVTKGVQVTTPGSVVLGTGSLNLAASGTGSCNFGSPSCTMTAADAGLILSVPNHAAETAQTLALSAVRKSDSAKVCVPAFASTTKSITFSCAYADPSSGTLPVRVGGTALNASGNAAAACDAGGHAVAIAFDATGAGSATLQYADVGRLTLAARHDGTPGSIDAGLVMTGSTTVTVAPSSFGIGSVTAGPIKAGDAFSATVTAKNAAGAATPNFGREATPEGVTWSFARRSPTGSGARDGVLTGTAGAFAGGSMTSSDLKWSEVGTIDLSVVLRSASYLGTGLSASGSTGVAGAVGRFTPHHFDVTASAACGSFSHAGQPFTATLTAKNGLTPAGTTLNYDGSAQTTPNHAKAVTLNDAGLALGSLGSTATVAASAFTAGVAGASPAYTFTDKLTGPRSLTLRAVDSDAVSSSGYTEPSMPLRSSRLRIADGYGGEKSALVLQAWVEYWSGASWVPNAEDSCTALASATVAFSNIRGPGGSAAAWTTSAGALAISGGRGTLTLAAPSPAGTGSVDLALNLGTTTADQSCLASHPASTAGRLAWLRSRFGACTASWDRDPSARASFGIYSPETRRTTHAREIF